ncbi:MAG: hypothetical protein GDA56_10780 [Hormoscilla sp. GM7CHS1pb]|nr:hypothetical protein [Hormoscilla sp. GM7CHS1pb]
MAIAVTLAGAIAGTYGCACRRRMVLLGPGWWRSRLRGRFLFTHPVVRHLATTWVGRFHEQSRKFKEILDYSEESAIAEVF